MPSKLACLLACAGIAYATDGYVKVNFRTEEGPMKKLVRRDIPAQDLDENITLAISSTVYWLDMEIGTPSQPFQLQIDTGSSDTWVPASNTSACRDPSRNCPGGSFNPDRSSTFQLTVPDAFQIAYGDGTNDQGSYFSDRVTIGESVIPEGILTIGLATFIGDGNGGAINDGHGLVGIGYQALSQAFEAASTADYRPPTVIQAMVEVGDIEREAYSMYLNSAQSGKGAVIFGGVDPTKYTGELVALPVLPSPNQYTDYTHFEVALTGMAISDGDGVRMLTDSTFAVPVLLDSGTTSQLIPESVFSQISGGLGLTYGNVPCQYANSNASIIYYFGGEGGPSINVPISAMMNAPTRTAFDDGTPACGFLMEAEWPGVPVILGDSFMRSGYFVYDLQNNNVAIAQAKLNVTEEAITAIPSGTTIPGCTSTNTLIISATAVSSAIPEVTTSSFDPNASVLPGTPTFNLGAAATDPLQATAGSGSGSGSGSGGGGSGAASTSRPIAIGFAVVVSFVAGMCLIL